MRWKQLKLGVGQIAEVNRRPAFYAVDQNGGEFLDLRVIRRVKEPLGPAERAHRREGGSDSITTA